MTSERREPGSVGTGRRIRNLAAAGILTAAGTAIGTEAVSRFFSSSSTEKPPEPTPTLVAKPSPSSTPIAEPTPTLTPTPEPTQTPEPRIEAVPYTFQGRNYTGLNIKPETTIKSPIEGTIKIQYFQYINGALWTGIVNENHPIYPYINIETKDRKLLTFRLGALGKDANILVKDGEEITKETPLFNQLTNAPSSWRQIYDRNVSFQVVVSYGNLATGRFLDAGEFFGDNAK